jgi:hypothetical protein
LAAGHAVQQAADLCNVSVQAVGKWRRTQPEFMSFVRQLRRDLTEKAAGVLADAMTKAAGELFNLLSNKGAAIRLKAAEAILRHGHELNLLLGLQADVDQLKAERDSRGRYATPRLTG